MKRRQLGNAGETPGRSPARRAPPRAPPKNHTRLAAGAGDLRLADRVKGLDPAARRGLVVGPEHVALVRTSGVIIAAVIRIIDLSSSRRDARGRRVDVASCEGGEGGEKGARAGWRVQSDDSVSCVWFGAAAWSDRGVARVELSRSRVAFGAVLSTGSRPDFPVGRTGAPSTREPRQCGARLAEPGREPRTDVQARPESGSRKAGRRH